MNAPRPASQAYGLTTNRLEALSDGVLAIVVTLLVLDFGQAERTLAEMPGCSHRQILAYLGGLWPRVLGYVLSFVLIVIYWILHHVMFHHIHRVDRGLLWFNSLFLMTVAFLPFPAALLAEFILHESNVIVILYGAAHLVVGLSLATMWLYAARGRRLLSDGVDRETIRLVTRSALASPALYAVGIALSFVSMPSAIVIFALAPLIFILPGHLDRLWLCSRHAPRAVNVDDSLRESSGTRSVPATAAGRQMLPT